MSSVMRFDEWQDSNGVAVASGAGGVFSTPGAILQIVQTVKNDSASWASSSYADITGMSVSITPRATSSKILVLAQLSHGADFWNNLGNSFKLVRDSTDLMLSTGATVNSTVSGGAIGPAQGDTTNHILVAHISFLDSPSTTSATTYKIQSRRIQTAGSGTNYLNRSSNNTVGGSSSITLIEVAG